MIISHGRKFIFVHIPKTAGTALSLALEQRAMKDDILIGDTPKAVRRRGRVKKLRSSGRLWKHSKLTDIHGVVSDAQVQEYFVLTLVRNPWDRLVSYYHWLKDQKFDHPAVKIAKASTFTEFLHDPHTQRSIGAESYSDYVTDRFGHERCNAFVRIEQFQNDVAPFEEHLGFALGDLPKINASDRKTDYRPYYDDADGELIASLCTRDIQRFGYQF